MPKLDKKDIIETANQYRSRFEQYAKNYKDTFEAEFDKANETVVREELCSGSDMTLGYYCPSPVQDLLIGNVHRGKILKRVTKRSKPEIKYGFSEDGRMAVFIELPPEGFTNYDVRGFVLHDENTVTYICFKKSEGRALPNWIAQAEYDKQGRIICYTFGLFFLYDYNCKDISREIYTYSDEGMKNFIHWEWTTSNRVYQTRYLLHHDKDGYFTGFEALDSEFWKGHIFEITPSKRRKI